MTRNTFKVVSFDCDGVMFNSSRANRAYYDHLMERFALPALTDRQFAYAHMHTVDEALNFIVGDPRLLEQVQAYRRQVSYRPFIRHMVVEPHLHRLLNSLRPAYMTAIATNRTNTMSHVLEEHGLTDLFDKVVTASDVTYAKPHPEQLLLLLAHFAIDPREMVFIGDSELDAAAAHQAGVPFVAFGNPGLQAMAHIEHLGQIPRLLAP